MCVAVSGILILHSLPPILSFFPGRSRTVTRGANRGAREDLMSAMERQIKRCEEPVEPLLRLFFKQEKILFGNDPVL